MPGRRKMFTAKGDRMAAHVAAGYGGGKRGLSIGYAVATRAGLRLAARGGGKRKRTATSRTRRKKK